MVATAEPEGKPVGDDEQPAIEQAISELRLRPIIFTGDRSGNCLFLL
jgi:hypothetical protein